MKRQRLAGVEPGPLVGGELIDQLPPDGEEILCLAGLSFALLTSQNPSTIAANIALSFPESYGLGVNQLIATGLVLFVITLAVNMIARAIVSKHKEFSGAN